LFYLSLFMEVPGTLCELGEIQMRINISTNVLRMICGYCVSEK